MYSREELKNSGRAYADAVKEREITIFVRYITEGILTYAGKGIQTIRFPLLETFQSLEHGSDGLLNKYEPGPIPCLYINEIVTRLHISFPDTDIEVREKFLYLNWS